VSCARRFRSLIGLSLLLIAVGAANGFAAGTVSSTDLAITVTGSPTTQVFVPGSPFKDITWTMVVTNNGQLDDTNVTVSDPLPQGNTFVDSTTTQGTCTGGVSLDCSLGTLLAGDSVTVALVTTPTITGIQTNTPVVSGDLPETDPANNTATASVLVVACHGCFGPPSCVALLVKPKELTAGRLNTLHIRVRVNGKAARGVRVRIKGPGIRVLTHPSGRQGNITRTIKPTKAGIVVFRPVASRACKVVRSGVVGANIPVTG
jgi:uncharacterized repeat protein (TIGR01451 family)